MQLVSRDDLGGRSQAGYRLNSPFLYGNRWGAATGDGSRFTTLYLSRTFQYANRWELVCELAAIGYSENRAAAIMQKSSGVAEISFVSCHCTLLSKIFLA